MKIGIDARQVFNPKKQGITVYTLGLIRALQKIDHHNEYVIFVKAANHVCLHETNNFKIKRIPNKSRICWEQIQLPKAIKQEKIELMYFMYNNAPLRIKCPYILTLHNINYFEGSHKLSRMITRLYLQWCLPKVVQRAQYIISISDFEKAQFSNTIAINAAKLRNIYGAANDDFRLLDNTILSNKIQEKYKLPPYYILFLANTSTIGSLQKVLEAYIIYADSEKNPIKLLVAEVNSNAIALILKKINRIDIYPKIITTDYLPPYELAYVYNSALLFLYPTLQGYYGIPLIEAMACGTPIITANKGTMPEIAGNAAMLINPNDSHDIAQAIIKVLKNNDLYKHLKYSGLSRATAFSWELTAKKIIKLNETVLN